MRSLIASIMLLCCMVLSSIATADDPTPFKFTGKVADLRIPSDSLGTDYKGPSGIQWEDVNTTKTLTRPQWAQVGKDHKRWQRAGVTAVGDFAYVNKKKVDNISIRVMVFASADQAKAFWAEKYDREDAGRDFKPVLNVGDVAVDSAGARHVRHVLRGNVILTASQEKDGNKHIVMLQKYMNKLEGKEPTGPSSS